MNISEDHTVSQKSRTGDFMIAIINCHEIAKGISRDCDKIRHDKTRQDQTREEKKRQDKTR
jgi:hypothetical protein